MDAMVGREPELAAARAFLSSLESEPGVLVLSGGAGIGKTTVWRAAVEEALARGFTVLSCSPAQSEANLTYVGLSDMLADLSEDVFHLIPARQRRALSAALLRDSGGEDGFDQRIVAAGLLSLIDTLSRSAPVMVAIDDIQWLDTPSLAVVESVLRRCRGLVGGLIAYRTGDLEGIPLPDLRPRHSNRLQVLTVGSLTTGSLHRIIRAARGHPVARPVVERIAKASGGNPFFALELARHLDDRPGDAPSLPETLQAVIQERLMRLPEPVLEALRIVAMLTAPSVELVERMLGDGAMEHLTRAEDVGLIEIAPGGEIRFSHPLLATGVLVGLAPGSRRALHRGLSAIEDNVEARARHLALAAIGFDNEVVRALRDAAEHARRRGAPAAAAELLEMAMQHHADDGSIPVQAAQDSFNAGDPSRARLLLEGAMSKLPPGSLRASALGLLGVIRFDTDALPDAAALLEEAILQADSEPKLRCSLRIDLSFVLFITGKIPEAIQQADLAVEEAESVGVPGLLAEALASSVVIRFLSNSPVDDAVLTRALALEDAEATTHVRRWPSTVAAQVYRWTRRLDEAQASFATLRQRCIERGAESDLWFVSLGAIPAACWSGNLETARSLVADMLERSQMVESRHAQGMAHLFEAQYLAWIGDVDAARRAAAQASTFLGLGGPSTIALEVPASLGLLELSMGDYEAAAGHLADAAVTALAIGFTEPSAAHFLPDAAEALIALGRLDEALPIVELLQASGRTPGRVWAHAAGARCQGLFLAAQGRLEEAIASYREALDAHDLQPHLQFDRARTLLVLAAVQRRTNRRRDALENLEEATSLFLAVGASRWAERAQNEALRLGLKPGAGEALTPREEQVARLAASGHTNREVATRLFVSAKTVDAILGRIYRKLGIRSRAELGSYMSQRPQQLPPEQEIGDHPTR